MRLIVSFLMVSILAAMLVLPLAELPVLAQAPTGPQGGPPPQQQNPPKPGPPAAEQQAPQSGVSISVEVPVVTLDVVATTQHGDIIPGLKKENFRVLEDGQPQTITNFGP